MSYLKSFIFFFSVALLFVTSLPAAHGGHGGGRGGHRDGHRDREFRHNHPGMRNAAWRNAAWNRGYYGGGYGGGYSGYPGYYYSYPGSMYQTQPYYYQAQPSGVPVYNQYGVPVTPQTTVPQSGSQSAQPTLPTMSR